MEKKIERDVYFWIYFQLLYHIWWREHIRIRAPMVEFRDTWICDNFMILLIQDGIRRAIFSRE